VLKNDLQLSAYKTHGLTRATVEKRFKRTKILLSWHVGDGIFFSEEKMFVLEQQMKVQNDRVWSVSLSDIPREKLTVPRYQNESAVMVWGPISRKGRLLLVFIDRSKSMLNTKKLRFYSVFYFRRPKIYVETGIIASSKMVRHHTQQKR
jgi:hypothetical protein